MDMICRYDVININMCVDKNCIAEDFPGIFRFLILLFHKCSSHLSFKLVRRNSIQETILKNGLEIETIITFQQTKSNNDS